jgi:hypothetical protein
VLQSDALVRKKKNKVGLLKNIRFVSDEIADNYNTFLKVKTKKKESKEQGGKSR